MCGIFGVFGNSTFSGNQQFSLQHRGPDSHGLWTSPDGFCQLAHTRLAIQDLSEAGHQPITSHCGRFTLVYNGEIYNHLSLRKSLRFHEWRGSSDSETLVEGIAERGPLFLLEIRGMFAFAAYDSHKQQMLLARDRLGIKPLYTLSVSSYVYFSSERRLLTDKLDFQPADYASFLAWGHMSTPATFSASMGIPQPFPSGSLVRFNTDRPHHFVRYWPPQPRPNWTPLPIYSYTRAQRFLRDQLLEAVDQHLISDVPIASFLSSGLDSGILTALASTLRKGQISSFTVTFPGQPEDESCLASAMARHCNTQHHEFHLRDDLVFDWIEAGLSSLDVPTADGLNTYLVSRCASLQGFRVAISGLGADELFGGYPAHRFVPMLRLLKFLPDSLRNNLHKIPCAPALGKLHNVPQWNDWYLTLALRRWFSDSDLQAAGLPALRWPESPPSRITQQWGRISYAELFAYTEPMLLRDSDVMSMASSLELRVPFLDHRIVELALRMPQRFQRCGKYLLRDAFSDLFPVDYLHQPKRGFGLPMSLWMRGPLRGLCIVRLDRLKDSRLLTPTWVDSQWQSFLSGHLHWTRIWSLIVLGEYYLRGVH